MIDEAKLDDGLPWYHDIYQFMRFDTYPEGIDIIGKILPKSSSGHEFILAAIDYFTKWVEVASYARLTSCGVSSDHTLSVAMESLMRATPYSLVYGMEAVLPIEIEMGSLRVALE
ncbi:hypothetical protein CK203_056119 [Vitis vinifera]|uniref:Integrase catalytic domain-containing protein n=1 Tax=Vitis vinifera TaxID=29760 RepID=A0A438H518_VITVI|nr:hypothetical protein CK203_056119 [Vitis vinifera]